MSDMIMIIFDFVVQFSRRIDCMSDEQKPVNMMLVRQTLEEEGCPEDIIRRLEEFFKRNPGTTLCRLNRQLDTLVSESGHTSYRAFRRAGFQQHGVDPLLVSWV